MLLHQRAQLGHSGQPAVEVGRVLGSEPGDVDPPPGRGEPGGEEGGQVGEGDGGEVGVAGLAAGADQVCQFFLKQEESQGSVSILTLCPSTILC